MPRKGLIAVVLTGCLLLSIINGFAQAAPDAKEESGTVTVFLQETQEAFPNPMKGFRPTRYIQNTVFPQGEYVTTCKQYIKYTDLESSPVDTAQKIIDWSNAAWKGIEERNLKVIPRVVIMYPSGPDGGDEGYWPEGINHNDPVYQWLTDPLKRRLRAFVAKIGEAWDQDPRVAAVEVGLWGKWGEHHISPLQLPNKQGDRIPPDFQLALGEAFTEAFPHKKLMVRYPETFTDYNFGYYWDSFALPDDAQSGKRIIARRAWLTQMISGEVAYDWGDQSDLGGSPDATLSNQTNTDYILDWVSRTHASSLGWIADYSQHREDVAVGAARLQKALGCRFVIRQATYSRLVQPSEMFSITFNVENVGSAPFYYPWPVEVSLLDASREPVWRETIRVDIRNWRPGYTYAVQDGFTLPEDLPRGTYTVALSVLDPSGLLPSLRFANTQYYIGGRTPLGLIGVGQEPEPRELGPFDSLYDDHSLRYTLEGEGKFQVEDIQVYPEEPEEEIQEEINAIMVPGNLAFQKPVTVSSTETQYDNYAPKATDGDPATRWSSEWGVDPSWIAVDLQDVFQIDHVNLSWEWSYAKRYQIQVSLDGESWTSVYETDQGKGNREEIFVDPVLARYVRIFCIQRALQWGYSLYEVEVFQVR